MADLDATRVRLGNSNSNQVGRQMERLLHNGSLIHLGPNFPTNLSRNSRTTPDLILCNNKAFHNININSGPVTLSDLNNNNKSDNKTNSSKSLEDANCENFQQEIRNSCHRVTSEEHIGKDEIDNILKQWYDIIDTPMNNNIPTTN